MLSFLDINELRRQAAALRESTEYAEALAATVRQPVLVLRQDLRIELANSHFYRTFDVEPEQTENHPIYELGNGQWNIARLRELLEAVGSKSLVIEDYPVEHDFPTIGHRTMLLNARRFFGPDDTTRIILAIEDVTDRAPGA